MTKLGRFYGGGKLYLTQNEYLRNRFGTKVIKIPLCGGFTCPNIDGSKGIGGCTYCTGGGSGVFGGDKNDTVSVQFEVVRALLRGKWGDGLYIPYFQANTGTYAPLERLRALYEEALSLENVVGLAIATRADCISNDTAAYLMELSKRTYLTVELGLQTIHDDTAQRINRCHSYTDFLEGYEKLAERGINVVVHIINGLPYESREMMLRTAEAVGQLHPHGVKIHMLHLIRGTKMAAEYEAHPFHILTLEEYVDIVCDQLELLPEDTVIQRVTGDGDPMTLIAPLWTLKKFVVMNEIDKELRRRRREAPGDNIIR